MAHQQVTWTIVLLAPALFFLALPVGSSYAALQLIFPNQIRGQVSALLLFTLNVGGLILGPWLVGVLNDIMGLKMVGYSLGITVGLGSLVSCAMFRVTYGPYRKHYAMMHDGWPNGRQASACRRWRTLDVTFCSVSVPFVEYLPILTTS